MFLRVYSLILLAIIVGGGMIFPFVNASLHIGTGPLLSIVGAGLFFGCVAAVYAAIPLLVLMVLIWLAFVRAV